MNEQALKERLKTIAKSENRTFQEIWKQLLLERILVRLSQSKFKQQFIFKGGLLLSHYIPIGRETQDIDLLNRVITSNHEQIRKAFESIFSIIIKDGFIFQLENMDVLSQPHMPQSGFRLKITAQFESMTDSVFIDLATGDDIDPVQELFRLLQYKGTPLFEEGPIFLQVYPIEAIFADKLDSIFSRGETNSRMKDFHDLLLMCRTHNQLNPSQVKLYIDKVFKNKTKPFKSPIYFSSEAYNKLQPLWQKYQKGLGEKATQLKLPQKIENIIDEINIWLNQHLTF